MTRERSLALEVAYLTETERAALFADKAADLETDWRFYARPDQILPPPDEWPGSTAYMRGGRGSGKSFGGSNNFAELILTSEPGEWACVSPTMGDARSKQIESDESGLIKALGGSCGPSGLLTSKGPHIEKWNRSVGQLSLNNGSIVYCDGADDGAFRIQGLNLRGCWADEVGLWRQWQVSWEESIGYAIRLPPAKVIATGTPKRSQPARKLVKQLAADPTVINVVLSTLDNAAFLDPKRLKELIDKFSGTRLGRQELLGEILEDGGGFFQRHWFTGSIDEMSTAGPFILDAIPPGHDRRLRFWDLAATEPGDSNSDPDWTAGAKVSYNPTSQLWLIEHIARFRKSPGARDEAILATSARDGLHKILVEQEPGSAGKSVAESLDTLHKRQGQTVEAHRPSGRKGVRAEILATAAERGARRTDPLRGPGVALLRGDWDIEAFLEELTDFDPDDENAYPHDDQVDAVSSAMSLLESGPPGSSASPAGRQLRPRPGGVATSGGRHVQSRF